jgi:hypothetical protein
MMDTFQASNASNVPTREKQFKKRGDLQTARMARFGRETALSRDFLTLRKRPSKCAHEDRQMLLYVQTWLPLLIITLTAATFFGVASFMMAHATAWRP